MAASRPIMRPRVNVLYTFPVSRKGSGAPGISNAAVERRKARPVRQDRSRAPCKGTDSLRFAALCSLFGSEDGLRPFGGSDMKGSLRGAKSKIKSEARAVFRSEDGEAWLFDN